MDTPFSKEKFAELSLIVQLEIYAWQLTVAKYFSEYLSREDPSAASSILQTMKNAQNDARRHAVDQLYADYGELYPEIKELLSRKLGDDKP